MNPHKLNRELRVNGRVFYYAITDTIGSLCVILCILLLYPWVWAYAKFRA